jgi:uncharacterized protein with HEPN domain
MSEAPGLRIRDYLEHMLDAMQRIEKYVADIDDADEFARRTIVHDAVVRNLEIIGEAARNVRKSDAEFTAMQTGIPWAAMSAMRNRITHGYFDINLSVVWQTVRTDLPALREGISALIRSLDG